MNNISTKRNDETDIMFVASTHDNVLFFTTKGLMYKKRGYQIPEAGKTGKGTHLANLLSLDSNELVTNTIPMESLDAEGYILMTTRHG
ncbi:DNA gyrase C-terminal beta-propeller domain-containing protein, partial [Streptomyces scabiei]|uniref:DNA gyrase C-terminal beta-propeller domain-containing protein n=1 Tax=Streptomyces scabiei TaxID=1930 RepID=UPI0038F724D3